MGRISGSGYLWQRSLPLAEKSKYRNKKAEITMNVLGVCSPDMQFIYILHGWEGSTVDGRVLRDAVLRPNGLTVPRGIF